MDKADVQLPVTATLSGAKTIDPSGQKVISPATFTYSAAGPGTSGQVRGCPSRRPSSRLGLVVLAGGACAAGFLCRILITRAGSR